MLDALYKEAKDKMEKSVEAVKREFSTVRTGKATPQLLDSVRVEAYGSTMPLNQLGTVTAPEPRLLVVQAYDKSTVGNIIKAIQVADLGFNPSADGQTIRIPVPALNEERRQQLVKQCKDIAEKGRIAVRNARREANDAAKKAQKDKEISEDQQADALDQIQEYTDENIKKIDELLERKEKDLLEV
jgi:ribosome recycling factor